MHSTGRSQPCGRRRARASTSPDERSQFDGMFRQIETTFVQAARDAFKNAFLIAAAFAFVAAALLVVDARRPALAAIVAGCASPARRRS